jgi:uncharacterized protein YkwD
MHFRHQLFLVVLFLAVVSNAHPAGPPVSKGSPALLEAIEDLLAQSDERFRLKDFRGSNRILEGGLRILRGIVVDRPELKKQIDRVLIQAQEEVKGSVRTALYRAVLVRIQTELGGRARVDSVVFTLSSDEQTLLELTNKERVKEGLRPLRACARLFEAARKHSANMARQQRLDHTLDGKGPGERLRDLGYRSFGLGENCAGGQRTPAEAISNWLGSPGHRRNMLNATYVEVGLGIATGENGVRYWTQVFAVPARP